MADDTYRGLLENISETSGTYKQMLQAIAAGGGGSGQSCVLFVKFNNVNGTLDKTWQEIYDAMNSSVLCVVCKQEKDDVEGFASIVFNLIRNIVLQEGSYSLYLDDDLMFTASTANDYPAASD